MRAIRCPYSYCTNVKRNGKKYGKQTYFCHDCKMSWSNKSRPHRKLQKLWHQYAFDGRSVASLAKEYKVSSGCIRAQLGTYIPPQIVHKPRTVAVIMDVTYFDGWGMLVVIDPYADTTASENTVLYWVVVDGTERTIDYEVAADTIESLGYSIIAVTIDGRRGVKSMLEAKGIPVQYCQFHQLLTVTKCLTKRPRLIQNIELRAIALTKRWSHERTRRAYFSLCRNLPNLFTHQHDYLQEYTQKTGKKIANTTSPLDGRFGAWKNKLIAHRGCSKERTTTILCSFFSEGTD